MKNLVFAGVLMNIVRTCVGRSFVCVVRSLKIGDSGRLHRTSAWATLLRMEGNKIRRPGLGFDLSDEELLAAPVNLLTKVQRKRRRILKRRISAAKQNKNSAL